MIKSSLSEFFIICIVLKCVRMFYIKGEHHPKLILLIKIVITDNVSKS